MIDSKIDFNNESLQRTHKQPSLMDVDDLVGVSLGFGSASGLGLQVLDL